MPLSTGATRQTLPPSVLAYCERHQLTEFLRIALSLAAQCFEPVREMRVGVEADPETDEEAVVIDVSAALGSDEVVARKRRYTLRWVESVPPAVIGRIRLLFDVD